MAAAEVPLPPGLYLVGTPIGNLEDISLRALRVLRSVDRILCEDTRETRHLLDYYEIRKPLTSCHEHNEEQRASEVVASLLQGERIAMVSDAGLPGISDPGSLLARVVSCAGLPVVPVPGANAALTAIMGSGFLGTNFLFCGFLPAKPGARLTELERLRNLVTTSGEALALAFYEAPHRILDTLADLETVWGPNCAVVLGRELTKLHEEFLRGTVAQVRAELMARERVRGEFVLLVEAGASGAPVPLAEPLGVQVQRLIDEGQMTEMEALKIASRERGIGKSEAYRQWQRERRRR
jgi:16S rRNA (cytidine1402-2'-O)-methyltransferase